MTVESVIGGTMSAVQITVIVPFWRDPRLRLCIEALSAQTLDPSEFEVILVNNDPEDTTDYNPLPPNMRVITEAKPGSYAARNAGLREAKGDIIAFTDADCIPDADWLEQGLRAFSNPAADLISGPIEVFREKRGTWLAWKYDETTAFQQRCLASSGTAVTANVLVRGCVFDTVGAFDESQMSGGDREFTLRATRAGCRLFYDAKVRVSHPARERIADVIERKRRIFGARTLRARNDGRLGRFCAQIVLPPFRQLRANLFEQRSATGIFLSFWIGWYLKLHMIAEVARVLSGAESRRR